MNRKKIIVIISVSAFLILFIALLMNILSSRKEPTINQPITDPGTPNQPSGSNTTGGSTGFGNITPSPDPSENNGLNIKISLPDNASYSFINNANDQAEVRASVQKFMAEAGQPNAMPRKWTQFFNADKSVLPLSKMSSSAGMTIKKELFPIIDDYDYELFYCSEKDAADHGFHLTVKHVPGYPEDTLVAAGKMMKQWEGTILSDTHNILFPGVPFNEEELKKPLSFKDGKWRFADILLPGGKKSSINYGLVGNYIVITSSLDCMNKTSADLIAPSD